MKEKGKKTTGDVAKGTGLKSLQPQSPSYLGKENCIKKKACRVDGSFRCWAASTADVLERQPPEAWGSYCDLSNLLFSSPRSLFAIPTAEQAARDCGEPTCSLLCTTTGFNSSEGWNMISTPKKNPKQQVAEVMLSQADAKQGNQSPAVSASSFHPNPTSFLGSGWKPQGSPRPCWSGQRCVHTNASTPVLQTGIFLTDGLFCCLFPPSPLILPKCSWPHEMLPE